MLTASILKRRFPLMVAAGAATVAAAQILAAPRSFWELDEVLFARGVLDFDPLSHHPHPPGYPLLIGLGKLLNFAFDDPFRSLLVLSIVSTILMFIGVAAAIRNVTGSEAAGILAGILLIFSPAMLIDGSLPMSDPPALASLAIALWIASSFPERLTDRRALCFGLACSAAIGCRPQFAVAVLPMFFYVLWEMRHWRSRRIALVSFTFFSAMWLVPLITAVGGIEKWIGWETRQASYVATHDAEISRGSRSVSEILLRFIAHPWGVKVLSMPVLFLAALGLRNVIKGRSRKSIPILLTGAVHLLFAITTMDPADGVRYVLPSLIAVALLVAFSFSTLARVTEFRYTPAILVAIFAIASWFYVRPITRIRAKEPSPPVQAARWANRNLPPDSVILWETSLRPHAELLLTKFRLLPVDAGLREYFASPAPLFIYADGGALRAGTREFSWPMSDAYGKLTRDHYRVVSLIPVPPSSRFIPLSGVYPYERTPEGKEWRWLSQHASISVAPGGSRLLLTFSLPPDAPYANDEVTVTEGGVRSGSVVVKRGGTSGASFPVPPGRALEVTFDSSRSYVPARSLGNRDPRRLAVQLTMLERSAE